MSLDRAAELEKLKRAVLLKRLRQQKVATKSTDPLPALVAVPREADMPLSFAQQRLWFVDQLDAEAGVAYQIRAALRLRGTLDRKALQRALDGIVARHEVLRTRFVEADGIALQRIEAADVGLQLADLDLRTLDQAARGPALDEFIAIECRRRFDLRQGPLIRGCLVQLGAHQWVLWLAQHHIISDAWSVGVLIEELNAGYAAARAGLAAQLPPLAVQYADYASWQQACQGHAVTQAHVAFWREHLLGAPALLELPLDRPRKSERSFAGALLQVDLGPELSAGVNALAKQHGCTIFMVLLTAWSTLLARLSGQNDVVVGTPFANRSRRELEALLGFFVNTLALRVRIDGDDTGASLLAKVKQLTHSAFSHAELPFDQVVDAVQPVRSPGHSPLFQTMLALDNTHSAGNLSLAGLEASYLQLPYNATHYDLTLSLDQSGATIVGSLAYSIELFERSSVERFLGCWRSLLAAMVAEPATPIARLPLLDAQSHAQLLELCTTSTANAEKPRSVLKTFAQSVQQQPTAIALRCRGRDFSYDQIASAASALAGRLRARGIGREDIVGLCVERSEQMAIGVLGVLKAGAAYLPLDPAYPRERLAYMVSDSGARLVVCERASAASLAGDGQAVLVIDEDCEPPAIAKDDHPVDVDIDAETTAYVIYTSGSTGQPRGVLVPHAGLANVVTAYQTAIPLLPGQRVLHFVSLSFDAATAHLFLALCSGATLFIHDRNAADTRDLAAVLKAERIHYVGLPVSVLATLSEEDLPELRYLSTGTESCPMALVERWGQGRNFVNIYGPTETSICSTMSEFAPGRDLATLQRPPIGRPIRDTRVYVLDSQLQPLPIGVVGELFIAGRGVARGYVGRPGLSAERFVPDPYAIEPGSRMYRTGDLARLLDNGEFDFVGRRDAQVKLRGFRIELGEVEAALLAHTEVHAAAATIVDAGSDQARLIGYVVTDAELAEDLALFLRNRLPAHLLPSAFVRIERLPLTANGKLDRAALPRPESEAEDDIGAEPNTVTGRTLASIWRELLRRQCIAANADFFALGGHSLLATQLISRINRHFGLSLPLKLVFDAPLLKSMAQRIDAAIAAAEADEKSATSSVPLVAAAATAAQQPQVLSFAQQRLWFLEQMDPGDASYHIPGALRLRGRLNVDALRRSLHVLQARHTILRTRIISVDGSPMQIVEAEAVLDMPLIEVGNSEVATRFAQFAQEAFDFARAPLFRAVLLHVASDEHVLLVTMHHIISDGWSLGVLVGELAALYRAEIAGADAGLPPLALQYADFARWQRQWLAAGELDRQLDYWRQRLQFLPPLLELPTDRPRPRERSGEGAVAQFNLPAQVVADLRALGRREGATLFMSLLAAFKVLLAKLSGETDIFVGSLVANRNRVELESLIGFFVNTLVLRSQVDGSQSFRSFLQQVRDSTLAAYEHQDVPFEQLVESLRPPRSLAYTPLFQVLCSMQNTPGGDLQLPGVAVEMLASELRMAKFDLAFDFKEIDAGVHCEVEYAVDLFSADTIDCWIEGFQHIVTAVARDASQAIDCIPFGDAEVARQFQQNWQGVLRPFAADTTVPAQILAQVARRPQATAYVGGGERLSYAELDRRSNQLARVLLQRGVGTEVAVGVCLERGPELAVAILAVWKAGGVYLPMDPEYPPARLAFMLRDSGAALVLAQISATALETSWTDVSVLDPTDDLVSRQSDVSVALRVASASVAYLIYTSGSTGTPKGVQVDHRALAQHCLGVVEAYGLREDDCVLHFAALGFDISLDQLLPTWVAGAAVVARDPDMWTPRELAEKLVELDISVADLPSALWHIVVKEWSVDSELPFHHRLRLFLVGGEAMASESLRHWRSTPYAQVPLLNGYGPTETTITSSGHWCTADAATTTVPIGRPFANRRFYVLDHHLQLLPPGFPGELFIGGEGLARGYRGQPGLTAAGFLPDPHARQDSAGARMYRSGDRVRFRADGALEFLGRVDGQVKLHGYRIELEEVESALRVLPGVRDAAAAVPVLANGERRLVGYLLLEAGVELDSAKLRLQLSRDLPEHFVPSLLMAVDDLPLINGKIHRRALPTPEMLADEGMVAPRTDTEAWLAALWAELLGLAEVGVASDFFALGGHSLLATQLLSRVRHQCAVQIPLRQLFDAPTVAEMAIHIDVVSEVRAHRQAGSTVDCEQTREEIEL